MSLAEPRLEKLPSAPFAAPLDGAPSDAERRPAVSGHRLFSHRAWSTLGLRASSETDDPYSILDQLGRYRLILAADAPGCPKLLMVRVLQPTCHISVVMYPRKQGWESRRHCSGFSGPPFPLNLGF